MEMIFNDENFESEVLNAEGPVVVDFFATWCGPCAQLAPVVESLAEEYDGKVKIGKLDVDENPETTDRYQVMSIPTLIFYKDGKAVDKTVGVVAKDAIVSAIEKML